MKNKSVSKGLMFCVMLTLALVIQVNAGFAQKQSFDFQKSFIRSFNYPDELRSACTPTFTNLLISVSSKGKVEDMLISDSASDSFKNAFNLMKDGLDTSALKSIIAVNKLKSCNIIMPIFYVYAPDYCTNTFEPIGYLSENYLLFNGHSMHKLSFNLKPVMISLYKPVH